ncbi:hemolymph lipopolysaccharide-binding protein-like [Ischnura elegans]|uniref:hemolymph lipopolysaccharide-binding protein-like n=1 Tax=Ischnura elegans TaxID=197161 RepID=UPI001ED891A7|nr:hemolymph lipopolysaccharide-binding protein-like [Ischnura elegans]
MIPDRVQIFCAACMLLSLQHCTASPIDTSSSHLNKTLRLSISSMKNKTGHWFALFSVDSNATRIATNWNADLDINTKVEEKMQFMHALGVYAEAPHGFHANQVPARYTLYPGVGYYKMYNLTTTHLSFTEAFYNCSYDGGHMAIINSEAEANLFKSFWKKFPTGGSFVYLGFNDLHKAGEFRTILGQTLEESGYNKWGPNEPSGKSLCGFFDENALHRVMSCTSKRPFLCEYPHPEL